MLILAFQINWANFLHHLNFFKYFQINWFGWILLLSTGFFDVASLKNSGIKKTIYRTLWRFLCGHVYGIIIWHIFSYIFCWFSHILLSFDCCQFERIFFTPGCLNGLLNMYWIFGYIHNMSWEGWEVCIRNLNCKIESKF